MSERTRDVLIVGASTRAMAQSAARAGFRVTAVDAYGDRDLLACAATIAFGRDLHRSWSAGAAAREAAKLPPGTVAYVSNFENHPAAVATLASGRELWGNAPRVLGRVRNPFRVAATLRRRGIPVAALSATPVSGASPQAWLLKPRRSGGGHGIRPWLPGGPVPRSNYLQEQVEGIAGSITFVADGRRAVPLGLTFQLVGEEWLGASGYRYCGNLLCGGPNLFPRERVLRDAAAALAAAITDSFALVGVNGIDFIARDGTPWLLEVNPRFSASMELVEQEHGVSVFALHAAACRGALPRQSPYCRRLTHVAGKAIVYARSTSTVRPAGLWESKTVADIPHPGERIAGGRPICTVFARGSSARECRSRLAALAASVSDATGSSRRTVA